MYWSVIVWLSFSLTNIVVAVIEKGVLLLYEKKIYWYL
jgi:hypothetical protein